MLVNSKNHKHVVRWSSSRGSDTEFTCTLEDIITVVTIDLHYCYQRRGNDILLQSKGCPIGGFLSAIYANITCSYYEFNFMNKISQVKKRIYGIRQVDDLILFIAYNPCIPSTRDTANIIKNTVVRTNYVYRGGLELEEQPPLTFRTQVRRDSHPRLPKPYPHTIYAAL